MLKDKKVITLPTKEKLFVHEQWYFIFAWPISVKSMRGTICRRLINKPMHSQTIISTCPFREIANNLAYLIVRACKKSPERLPG